MFGGIFHDFLEQPWEQARGYLKEELEQLQMTLAAQWSQLFDTDGTLKSEAIDGASTTSTLYVSNEGPGGKPKWAKINLLNGVKSRLRLENFTQAAGSNTLLGRDTGAGNYESIS